MFANVHIVLMCSADPIHTIVVMLITHITHVRKEIIAIKKDNLTEIHILLLYHRTALKGKKVAPFLK